MILAIDSSTQWIGIALFDANMIQYEKIWKASRRHTVELAPAIKHALYETDTRVDDLTAVGAAIGPGSFTSLRIGLAIAKGLALSQRIPIIGVPSLDILAKSIPPQDKPLMCLLRAGRGRLAAQLYLRQADEWAREGEITAVTAEELESSITKPTLIAGELSADEKKIVSRRWRNAILLEAHENIRRPSILATIAQAKMNAGDVSDTAAIAPIYVRTVRNDAR